MMDCSRGISNMKVFKSNNENIVALKMVEKLGLARHKHPRLYKLHWSQKGYEVLVVDQCHITMENSLWSPPLYLHTVNMSYFTTFS